jgi:hypothetical protein
LTENDHKELWKTIRDLGYILSEKEIWQSFNYTLEVFEGCSCSKAGKIAEALSSDSDIKPAIDKIKEIIKKDDSQ